MWAREPHSEVPGRQRAPHAALAHFLHLEVHLRGGGARFLAVRRWHTLSWRRAAVGPGRLVTQVQCTAHDLAAAQSSALYKTWIRLRKRDSAIDDRYLDVEAGRSLAIPCMAGGAGRGKGGPHLAAVGSHPVQQSFRTSASPEVGIRIVCGSRYHEAAARTGCSGMAANAAASGAGEARLVTNCSCFEALVQAEIH